jgi:hypothetical protein
MSFCLAGWLAGWLSICTEWLGFHWLPFKKNLKFEYFFNICQNLSLIKI